MTFLYLLKFCESSPKMQEMAFQRLQCPPNTPRATPAYGQPTFEGLNHSDYRKKINLTHFHATKLEGLKNMQFTGQKVEQPASTACLLARKCHWLTRKMAANMRNVTWRGQKLQSFQRKWPFYMDLYSMPWALVVHDGILMTGYSSVFWIPVQNNKDVHGIL
jgi:hypothetical protein